MREGIDVSYGQRPQVRRQRYPCPGCGAPVVMGEKFCVSCGINFIWAVEPLNPQSPSLSSGPQLAVRQGQGTAEATPRDQSQAPRREPARPISSELSKLVAEMFSKHARPAGN
jgi:hypothetical protein